MSFPAPTGGLIGNRNLAIARGPDLPPGASVLENMFPTATGDVVRRGSRTQHSLPGGTVKSLFNFVSGSQNQIFAATDAGIWDVSSTVAVSMLPDKTNGDWSVVQFTTAGGAFLVGVNGADGGFLFDGTSFGGASITFPDGETLSTSDLSYVWVYKQRLYFIQKSSLNVWYLPVDQIGGELTLSPMGGIFSRGGTLLWGQSWSLDNSAGGGLSEQVAFCTTEGEVAAYQGLSPDPNQGWTKVGSYRIGRPLGKKAFTRAGGDIVIATTVGFISLASASRQDYAALGQNAVSYPIEDDWTRAVVDRGNADWRCQVWADGQMLLVSPPAIAGQTPIIFACNTNTGRWSMFTGWDARSFEAFEGRLYFGTAEGGVVQGWVGGNDDGAPYVAKALTLFDDLGAPANVKVAKMARAVTKSAFGVQGRVSAHSNFNKDFPSPPNVAPISADDVWDVGEWNASLWDAERGEIVQQNWVAVGASGHDIAVGWQVTSGSLSANDIELIRMDLTYTTGHIGT